MTSVRIVVSLQERNPKPMDACAVIMSSKQACPLPRRDIISVFQECLLHKHLSERKFRNKGAVSALLAMHEAV